MQDIGYCRYRSRYTAVNGCGHSRLTAAYHIAYFHLVADLYCRGTRCAEMLSHTYHYLVGQWERYCFTLGGMFEVRQLYLM